MFGWDLVVGLVQSVLVVLTHAFGGSLGSAILTLSLGARLALLPLTLRIAIRARELDARRRALEPQVERIRTRHAADPVRVLSETQALYRRHGITLAAPGTLLATAIQLPLGAALFQAIRTGLGAGRRYLWIGDLARPDAWLAILVAVLASAAMLAMPGAGATASRPAHLGVLLSGLLTLFVVWRFAAGVGLYWAASNLVGVVQALAVRHAVARTPSAR